MVLQRVEHDRCLSTHTCVHYSISSVQFSCSVVSDSLRPHELQHARPPCPSPTPGVHSDSCLSSQWCRPAILSSVVPFSSCPQSLPASESYPMSQLFAWGGQSTGVSASASFLPKKSRMVTTKYLVSICHNTVVLLYLFHPLPQLLAGNFYCVLCFYMFVFVKCWLFICLFVLYSTCERNHMIVVFFHLTCFT